MPNLYDKLESEGLKDMIMENFYNYSIFSLCCNEHIPIDVAVRVFEVIIFEGLGDVSLVRLIIYMLMIMEDEIMEIEDGGARFKYLLRGKYIVDCVKNKAYWNYLVKDFLE